MNTTLKSKSHRELAASMGIRLNAKAKVVGVLLLLVALARPLGYDVIHRWSRVRPVLECLGKNRFQGALVLLSLIPARIPQASTSRPSLQLPLNETSCFSSDWRAVICDRT